MSETGTTHRISVHEGTGSEDTIIGGTPQIRRPFKVLKEIFKRGRAWSPGEVIELDPATGEAFERLGEVEPADSDTEGDSQ